MIEDREIKYNKIIKAIRLLDFNDYMKLQKDSKAIISDGGTISE